jgi:hypothetical protein
MKIHRPDCMKTPRQGSVSIPLSSAARSCVCPRRRPVWTATSIPLAATRRAPWPSQRATGFSGHCSAAHLPNLAPYANCESRPFDGAEYLFFIARHIGAACARVLAGRARAPTQFAQESQNDRRGWKRRLAPQSPAMVTVHFCNSHTLRRLARFLCRPIPRRGHASHLIRISSGAAGVTAPVVGPCS